MENFFLVHFPYAEHIKPLIEQNKQQRVPSVPISDLSNASGISNFFTRQATGFDLVSAPVLVGRVIPGLPRFRQCQSENARGFVFSHFRRDTERLSGEAVVFPGQLFHLREQAGNFVFRPFLRRPYRRRVIA